MCSKLVYSALSCAYIVGQRRAIELVETSTVVSVPRWKVSTDNEGSPANRFAYRDAHGRRQTESTFVLPA